MERMETKRASAHTDRIAYKELHSNISVKYRGCDELRIAYGFSWIHSLSVCLSLIFMYFLVSIFSSFDCSVQGIMYQQNECTEHNVRSILNTLHNKCKWKQTRTNVKPKSLYFIHNDDESCTTIKQLRAQYNPLSLTVPNAIFNV